MLNDGISPRKNAVSPNKMVTPMSIPLCWGGYSILFWLETEAHDSG